MLCGFLQSYGTTWLGKAKSFLPPVCTGIPPNSQSQEDEAVVFVMHSESRVSSLPPLNLPIWRQKAKTAHPSRPQLVFSGDQSGQVLNASVPSEEQGDWPLHTRQPQPTEYGWSFAQMAFFQIQTSVTLIYLNYLSYNQLIGENTKRLRHTSSVLNEQ